jgi:predicted enzyme related to lactoylglutathione lyase
MPPKIDGVTIIFNVRDIDRTERFYREHLGIDFERYGDDDHGAFLTARLGAQVEVMAFKGDPKPGNTPNVVFNLPDGGIDTVIASFAAAGIEIVTPVSEAPGGWFADFRDPDGHTVSFYQSETLPRTSA